jgi:NAD(P)H dehydrogenase (quinone)
MKGKWPRPSEALPVILVTGATGRVGYPLLEALADAGAEVTAMVRVPAKGADLPGTTKHIVASFDDPPPAEVLQTFDRIFLLSPALQEQAELEIQFIDAVLAAGHRPHILKMAADGFQDPGVEVRFVRSHREVAVHLAASGLPVSYLAPGIYMETLLAAADRIRREGMLYAPSGPGRAAYVAASDVADVAARVLTTRGHEDRTYVLTGPEALTGQQLARRISTVFGREVGYADRPAAQVRDELLARGLGQWEVDGALELSDWVREGGAATVTADVPELAGHPATPVVDWLDDNRAAFLDFPPGVPPDLF